MAGIFGPDAEMVRQAIAEKQSAEDMQWANVPQGRGMVAAAAKAGRGFGNAAGAAMGYQDPQVAKAKLLEEAKQEVDSAGVNLLEDSKGYYSKAFEALQKRGLMDEAMGVRQLMLEESATEADINYKNAQAENASMKGLKGRYTQNSKGQVVDSWTGTTVKEGSAEYEAASSSAKAYQDFINGAYGDPSSPDAQARYEEAISKINYKRPSTQVSVAIKGEEEHLKTVGKKTGEEFVETIAKSRNAGSILETTEQIDTLLEDPDLIVGPGGDIRLGIAKVMNIFGADNADTISATQALMSRLADTTLKAIPDSNLGGGQGFTERDKEFLERSSAGNFNWTPDSLKYLNWINKRRAYNLVKARNDLLSSKTPEQLQKLANVGADTRIMPLPEIGERPAWRKEWSKNPSKPTTQTKPAENIPPAPAGVDPEDWKYMAPEDKAKWNN